MAEDKLGVAQIRFVCIVGKSLLQKSASSTTTENGKKIMSAKIKVDINRIVKDFGGLTATSRKLKSVGNDISPNGVDKWRRYQSIPSKHLAALAVIARLDKTHFDLVDYTNIREIEIDR